MEAVPEPLFEAVEQPQPYPQQAPAIIYPMAPFAPQNNVIVHHPAPPFVIKNEELESSSDSSSDSENDDEAPLDFDDNVGALDDGIIDLTMAGEDEEVRVESDARRLQRINTRGEGYEVMPVDVDSFTDAAHQLAEGTCLNFHHFCKILTLFIADIAFSNRIVADLSVSTNKLKESWNAGDKTRDVAKNQKIARLLTAAQNLFTVQKAALQEFELAKTELVNLN